MSTDRERWNARWTELRVDDEPRPPGVLTESAALLPTPGRAVDLAGGLGDAALWLAQREWDVTLVDVADVALDRARDRAGRLGVAIHTEQVDLERESPPAGPWDLIIVSHYLHRPLLAQLPARLRPNGVVVIGIATRTNLERHPKPSARFLLDEGELPQLLPGIRVIRHVENWSPWGVHESRLVAGRSPDGLS
jgi:SAM-dependent methyltransferase